MSRMRKVYLKTSLLVVCSVLVTIFITSNQLISEPRPRQELSEKPLSSPDLENLLKLYDGVETFVLFIGYPRSRSSLVGALLDAHPEIIIPHEYNVIGNWERIKSETYNQERLQKYILFHELYQLSTRQAMFGFRAKSGFHTRGVEYSYHVPGLWQGRYKNKTKVIGDKKAGGTSMALKYKSGFLAEFRKTIQVPIKFIHVTRDPFDNIATLLLRYKKSREAVRAEGAKLNNTVKELDLAIEYYFKLAASNQRIRELYGDAVIDIPGQETVLRPKVTLQRLCDHLGVTCSEDYFEKCSKILFGTPSITRHKVVWTEEQKARVTRMMNNYSFLREYSFDKYPS